MHRHGGRGSLGSAAPHPGQPTGAIGPSGAEAKELPRKSGSWIPAANAEADAGEVSIGQSMPSSYFSNHSSPRSCGYSVLAEWRASAIHSAFEPPYSLEPTSLTISGLPGAILVVISS